MTDTNADRTDKSTDTEPDADLSANSFGLDDEALLEEFDADADAVDQLDTEVAELWDTPIGDWWP